MLRRIVGRVRGELVRQEVTTELHRLARSGRPIIAGPWLGEVGFEILYWVPFLRWAIQEFAIDPRRVIAISRGGPSSWYRDVAGRYIDTFDHLTVDAFRAGNERRRSEVGEQKQVREAGFDRELLALVRDADRLADAELLHPSLMYRLVRPYWWKHAGPGWVSRHARYVPFEKPALPPELALTPGTYFAVKFYFNDCVPDDAHTRGFASAALRRLADIAPVVSLSTDLALDDHAGAHEEAAGAVTSIASLVRPRNNLAVQTAVVANARAFVGTYGGFSYLAPFHRVPGIALYARGDGFDRAHLDVARRAAAAIEAPQYEVQSMIDIAPDVLGAHAQHLAA